MKRTREGYQLKNRENEELVAGDILANGVILPGNGGASEPALRFATHLDKGLFCSGANAVGVACGGTERVTFKNGSTRFRVPVEVDKQSDLTDCDIQFQGDSNTGIYSAGADELSLVAGGTARMTVDGTAITSTEPWRGPDGTAAAPGVAFSGHTDTGVYCSGGTLAMAVDASDRWRCGGNAMQFEYDTNDCVLRLEQDTQYINKFKTNFGNAGERLRLECTSGRAELIGGTGADIQLTGGQQVQLETNNFFPNPDNAISLGKSGNRWTAVYAANGTIQTSDAALKDNIRAIRSDTARAMIKKLKPSSWTWKDGDGTKKYGLIAQDVEDAKIDVGVDKQPKKRRISKQRKNDKGEDVFDGSGQPVVDYEDEEVAGEFDYGLEYSQFIGPLIRCVQDLYARIEVLENAT